MKHIIHLFSIFSFFVFVVICSCSENYVYNTGFTTPTELISPENITLDVTSSETVVLKWIGGGADDGSILQYRVLFAAAGGSFNHPVQVIESDLGALPQLTLTHSQLNMIARQSGIRPEDTGKIKWTVLSSKGGEIRETSLYKEITVTRGEGIDNIPQTLYLFGSATSAESETTGRAFRVAREGEFHIYTNLADGAIYFGSEASSDEGFRFFVEDGKLKEGDGTISVTTTGGTPVRIIVNFNTLSVKTEVISDIFLAWGWSMSPFTNGTFVYQGNGVFKATDVEVVSFFYDWGWAEERYRMILKIDGVDYIWGRGDDVSGEVRPNPGVTPVEWYQIAEHARWGGDQWEFLWKMAGKCEGSKFDVYIYTNKDNLFYHEFTNFRPL